MTLEEAINILLKLERTLAPTMAASGTDAIGLGIEALKRIQNCRKYIDIPYNKPLPGETEE